MTDKMLPFVAAWPQESVKWAIRYSKKGCFQIRESVPPTDDGEYWWRAEDVRYANYDPFEEYEQSGSHLVIRIRCVEVVKHTPKGVMVRDLHTGDKRFILGTSVKQYAVPTKELAIRDLVERKKVHVAAARARLTRAKEHLSAAQALLTPPTMGGTVSDT